MRIYRKSTPKVRDGKVQKKHSHNKTARRGYVIDRRRPIKGYQHVMKKKDIYDFICLIPDWPTLSEGIESIILDDGSEYADGFYVHHENEKTGAIWLSAWPNDLWFGLEEEYFQDHLWFFDSIRVSYEKKGDEWLCYFTKSQAKAFSLLHVFLHELGHHVDKMRSQNESVMKGGENFAEKYSKDMFDKVWPLYTKQFGHP